MPTIPPPQTDNFLAEFKALPNWLVWRGEKKGNKGNPTKVPYSARGGAGSSTDPTTWSSYSEAVGVLPRFDGLGFAITDGNVLIDLDECRDPETGAIEGWAQFIVDHLCCPTEISPSGTGLHIYLRSENARSLQRKFPTPTKKKRGIEIYANGRYSAITFNHLPGTPLEIPEVDICNFLAFVENGDFDPDDVRIERTCKRWEQDKNVYAHSHARLDLKEWLTTFHVDVLQRKPDGTILVACPGTHGEYDQRDGRAFLRQMPSGALAMGCLHQSCSLSNSNGNHWRQFRQIVEQTTSRTPLPSKPMPQAKAKSPVQPENWKEVDAREQTFRDMPESVLDGRLGAICRERMVNLPLAYAWPSMLAAGSVLARAQSKFNLYVAHVGPVGSGKSVSQEKAFHVLGVPESLLLKLKSGSAEGLAERAGDANGEPRLLYPDELAHLLKKSVIEGSSFPTFLTSAFYHSRQELTVKNRKSLVFDIRLSLAGGIVDEQFGELFGSASTGGLYDRFLFGLCPSGYQHLWTPFDCEPSVETHAVETRLSESVFQERDRWITELKITPRVAEICLRAAVICASLDGRQKLEANMLEPALELAKYQMRARKLMRPNPGENPDAQMAFMIREWLAQHAPQGEWTSRRVLDRAIHASRLGPGVFARAIMNMQFNGELEEFKAGNKYLVRLSPDESVTT